jgi:hypothetical protein
MAAAGDGGRLETAILAAMRIVNLLTNSQVKFSQMRIVLGPDDALSIASSAEITNYVRETPFSREIQERTHSGANLNELWGLPATYTGLPLVVEDASIVLGVSASAGPLPYVAATEPGGAGQATAGTDRVYIWPKGTAVLLSRIGGLDGIYGSPSFSTVQLYHYKQLLRVSAFDDPKHERTDIHVTEQVAVVIAGDVAGVMITGIS